MTDLRAAAERIPEDWRDWDGANCRTARAVVDAYLATTRPDDGESLSTPEGVEWFMSLKRDGGNMSFVNLFAADGHIYLMVNGLACDQPATRGQVRALCRVLNIELKE